MSGEMRDEIKRVIWGSHCVQNERAVDALACYAETQIREQSDSDEALARYIAFCAPFEPPRSDDDVDAMIRTLRGKLLTS